MPCTIIIVLFAKLLGGLDARDVVFTRLAPVTSDGINRALLSNLINLSIENVVTNALVYYKEHLHCCVISVPSNAGICSTDLRTLSKA